MAKVSKVEGFDAFKAKIAELTGGEGDVFVYFSGSPDNSGQSWCPDCVTAEPIVTKSLAAAAEDSHFLYVAVGDRTFWKDQTNIFRTAKETQLKSVPTLIKWGTKQRLQEGQLMNENLIKMMLED